MSTIDPKIANSLQSRLGRFEIKLSDWKIAAAQARERKRNPPAKPIDLASLTTLANPQPFSSFIQKLPFDIRSMIYELLRHEICMKELHIDTLRAGSDAQVMRWTYQPCVLSDPEYVSMGSYRSYEALANPWGLKHLECSKACQKSPWVVRAALKGFFNLAKSCRFIYRESTPILYATTTFHLMHLKSLHTFLTTTPPHSLHLIRAMCLSWSIGYTLHDHAAPSFNFATTSRRNRKHQVRMFKEARSEQQEWESVCRILATLPALQELRISLYHYPTEAGRHDLLEPLLQIKRPERFTVQVPWEEVTATEELEEGERSFRVVREEG